MMFASTLGFFVGLMLAGMIAIVFMIGMVAGLSSNSQAVYTAPGFYNTIFWITVSDVPNVQEFVRCTVFPEKLEKNMRSITKNALNAELA